MGILIINNKIISIFIILLISSSPIVICVNNTTTGQTYNIGMNAIDINFNVLTDKDSYKWIIEPIKITMEIKNNNNENFVLLRFPTTQLYDIIIEKNNGIKIYQWSDSQNFMPVITEIVIFPGETSKWDLSWNQKGHYLKFMPLHLIFPGEYRIKATLPLIDEEYNSESIIKINLF